MLRAFVLVLCVLVAAGCGGGGNGDSDSTVAVVEAFPDVLEVARAELPENAPILSITLHRTYIALVTVEFGRSTEIRYDLKTVFIGNKRITKPIKLAKLFSIDVVPTDAPARMLSAIQEREDGDVESFEATLARPKPGKLEWQATATVDGSPTRYRATLDGTLSG